MLIVSESLDDNTHKSARNVKRVSRLELPGAGQVTVEGKYAYVGHITNKDRLGTSILDVSDPWRPKVVGRFDPGFAAHDLAFSSDWRVWVTAADRRSVTIFDSRTRRPVARVAAGAPPQHVAFGPIREAFVTSGYGSSLEIVDRSSGRIRRTVHVPYGSFNVATFGSFVVTSSLLRGTVTELTDEGRVWMKRRVAPAARSVAVATF